MISKTVETESSLSFSSDYVRGVHACGHLRVSRVLLDGLRKKKWLLLVCICSAVLILMMAWQSASAIYGLIAFNWIKLRSASSHPIAEGS